MIYHGIGTVVSMYIDYIEKNTLLQGVVVAVK